MPFNSRDYRRRLGFTNQAALKKHFKATDIVCINWDKLEQFNQRLKDMFGRLIKPFTPAFVGKAWMKLIVKSTAPMPS